MHARDIHQLYDYNYWATHRLLGVVSTLSTEEFCKDRGSSHGGIRGTLVHTMGAEGIWHKRWKNEPIANVPKESDFADAPQLIHRWSEIEREVMLFCKALSTDEDVLRVFHYKDLKGNPYSSILYHAMQHLVNHSTYHRGQIVTMLRQAGVKPIATDLIVYYREKDSQS